MILTTYLTGNFWPLSTYQLSSVNVKYLLIIGIAIAFIKENLEIPTGVPEHIFNFPDQYGGMNMGIHLAQDQLQGVAEVSGVMSANVFDFIDEDLAHQCSQYLPNVDKIACADAIDAFRFLKNKVTH